MATGFSVANHGKPGRKDKQGVLCLISFHDFSHDLYNAFFHE